MTEVAEFTHPDGGWTIATPDDWERVEHPAVQFAAVEPERDDATFRMNVNVVAQELAAEQSAEAYVEGQVTGLRAADPSALIIEATPGTGADLALISLAIVAPDENRLTIVQRHVRFGATVALVCTLTVETYEIGTRLVEALAIIGSLELPHG